LDNNVRSTTLAVCIPAWNAASHLPRLLASIEAQTCPFDQVLVYDDASTDNTADIAAAFGATVVRAASNTGPSLGKNLLAERTTCEWVHFHDADEALEPQFVERARTWLDSSELEVLLLGTEDRDDVTGAVLGCRRWDDAALQADAISYCITNNVTNCGVYRRTAFLRAGGFDTADETKYNEDQAMHLRLALAGLRFRSDTYIGTIVYRRTNSMSSGHPVECARAHFHVLQNVAKQTSVKYSREIGERLWRVAGVSASHNDWDYVRRCVELAADLQYLDPAQADPMFRALARLSPVGAIRLREHLVRWLKPHLRAGLPMVSS
jgi:glycosyltransferase involved in cell wall biosynthesis